MPSDRSLWQQAAQVPELDDLGTDIYWVNQETDVREMIPLVQDLAALCRSAGKRHHEWLQAWIVKRGPRASHPRARQDPPRPEARRPVCLGLQRPDRHGRSLRGPGRRLAGRSGGLPARPGSPMSFNQWECDAGWRNDVIHAQARCRVIRFHGRGPSCWLIPRRVPRVRERGFVTPFQGLGDLDGFMNDPGFAVLTLG